ncbi:unnamed protein product [Amoebophrya sp. A120]|nr:unnamed protein product [Amoebophrya sp. A120]|eukprot:GSA120T00004766001.1
MSEVNLDLGDLFGAVGDTTSVGNNSDNEGEADHTRVRSNDPLDWDIDVGPLSLYFQQKSKLDVGAAAGVSTLEPVELDLKQAGIKKKRKQAERLTRKGVALSEDEDDDEQNASEVAPDHAEDDQGEVLPLAKIDRVRDDGILAKVLGRFGSSNNSTSSSSSKRPTVGKIAPVLGTGKFVKQQKKLSQELRGQTRNGLPKQELTPELERELKFLQMRAYADPTRFYRGNDSKELPTHFHLGVEVGGSQGLAPVHGDGRPTYVSDKKKKTKGVSFMQETLKDQRVQEFTRKRFNEVGAWGQEGSIVKKNGAKKKNAGKGAWKKKKKK